MKDNELRGVVMKALYDIRHKTNFPAIPRDVPGLPEVNQDVLYNIFRQLTEKGLIEFTPHSGGDTFGRGRISAYGIDIVEGTAASPIAISIDNSVSVQGSQNVQVGGQGNTQTVTWDVEKMISLVDSAEATVTEKEEAKSLLKKIAENKLVQMVLGKWLKSGGQA